MNERGERIAPVNGLEIVYDELGDPAGEPMLMVMGLGTQLIHWHPDLCGLLGERGFRVIRFDNRDAGRSTRVDAPMPGRWAMLGLRRSRPAYSLYDMAGDAAGLMDHLGIESAHVVGASMGGMIAQAVAIRHGARVRSLALVMTHPGKRRLAMPRMRAFATLLWGAPRTREGFIEQAVRVFRVIGSPGFETDETWLRDTAGAAYDRGHFPPGVARQLHAITSARDRTAALRELRVPTVVVHGDRDPLIRPAGGRSLARTIPDARLVIVPGMGHDLPRGAWPTIVEAIASNAERQVASRISSRPDVRATTAAPQLRL
jgi:pimeloyl-ACP methyl ester carboxylesterase